MKRSILVVDDESAFLESVERMLRLEGYERIETISDPTEVEELLEDQEFDAAILDITMPEIDGLDLLSVIKERSPETECVMVTANESIPLVIKAIKRGAYDYLVKPITPDRLVHALDRALQHKQLIASLLLRSSRAVKRTLDDPDAFSAIITGDKQMLRLLREAELHAASDIPILITGETGVGKEILAHAIHTTSRRAKGPFIAVNMLALSPTLFESEFFGHVKGAFTGADKSKVGYLGKAEGGTLFLDEIGDLSLEIQGKLLRILQEREYARVGDTGSIRLDIRFVTATNQDLERLVQQRKFRKDLFYRLQFAHLQIPPLRDRGDDLTLLVEHFLSDSSRGAEAITDDSWALLQLHGWPGNVRELKGALEAATNLAAGGEIKPEHFKLPKPRNSSKVAFKKTIVGELEPLSEVERRHILAVYDAVGSNKSQAARVLDIGLQTLHRKLKVYGVK